MLIVKVNKKENFNAALKRFKRKFRDTGVVKEIRKRQYFEKPSSVKRKAKLQAIYKQKFINEQDYQIFIIKSDYVYLQS